MPGDNYGVLAGKSGNNVDCKGISRGRCTECECDGFLTGNDVSCSYCSHSPVSHINLEHQIVEEIAIEVAQTLKFIKAPGSITVIGRVYPGELNQINMMICFVILMITFAVLFMLTFGLILIMLIPVVVVVMVCIMIVHGPTNGPRNNTALTFDNDREVLIGPLYGTIPYSQISLYSYYGRTFSVQQFKIYLNGVKYIDSRGFFARKFTTIDTNTAPNYVIFAEYRGGVVELKKTIDEVVMFTGLPHSESLQPTTG